jgi:hypothetical protein
LSSTKRRSSSLSFGWIDSLIKRLDEDLYAIKVTPRQPTSKWSELNRIRWKELHKAGLLAAPGLAAAPSSNHYAAKPKTPELPAYVGTAFKAMRGQLSDQRMQPTAVGRCGIMRGNRPSRLM